MTPPPVRPLPRPSEISQPFWDACREHRLLIQQAFCPHCLGRSLTWVQAAGTGSIVTYTVVWRPQTPAFETPYVIAVVMLDEGVDLLTNLVDVVPAQVAIGDRVRVAFADVDDMTLPFFTHESPAELRA